MVPWWHFIECGAASEVVVINSFKVEREEAEGERKFFPIAGMLDLGFER